MNPPEKIFLTSEDVKILGLNKDVVAPIGKDIETFEYHLAPVSIELEDFGTVNKINVICPNCGNKYLLKYGIDVPVWHDAVKDPPKEHCFILVCVYIEDLYPQVQEFYYTGRPLPEFYRFWMPLPEPPKESEEELDYDTTFKVKPKSIKTVMAIVHRPEPPKESTKNDTYVGDDDHAHDDRIL